MTQPVLVLIGSSPGENVAPEFGRVLGTYNTYIAGLTIQYTDLRNLRYAIAYFRTRNRSLCEESIGFKSPIIGTYQYSISADNSLLGISGFYGEVLRVLKERLATVPAARRIRVPPSLCLREGTCKAKTKVHISPIIDMM
jgi:hypothetical protein